MAKHFLLLGLKPALRCEPSRGLVPAVTPGQALVPTTPVCHGGRGGGRERERERERERDFMRKQCP